MTTREKTYLDPPALLDIGYKLPNGLKRPSCKASRLHGVSRKNSSARCILRNSPPSSVIYRKGEAVLRFPRSRTAIVTLVLLASATPILLSEDGGVSSASIQVPQFILIGFVGGFIKHDNAHQQPAVMARQIEHGWAKNGYVRVFENRHRKAAYKTILRLLDADHNGVLSSDEKSRARIVLLGHSWGASAAVMLARELDRAGVPVLLTVQIDSVAKPWQRDRLIPDNVTAAANFYQPHGLLHGRSTIEAADSTRTQILGNYRFDYRKAPVECEGYNWVDRFITPSHMQSECDPRLWGQVETLVRQRLQPEESTLTATSGP